MAQPGSDQAVLKARVAVDLGTTSTHVAVCVTDPANPAGFVDEYLLPFGSSADADRSKLTTELDTTIVFSEDGQDCLFGLDGLTRSGIFAFTDWKMGALGEKPFAQILANTCKALETSAPQLKPFGPATLFRRLFMYILKTAREHLRNKYGCAFDTIQCHLTYPVSCSESLRLLLLQEASAAGLDVTGAVSEPMSIAHALNTVKNLSLPPGARLIVDFGGATVVCCSSSRLSIMPSLCV